MTLLQGERESDLPYRACADIRRSGLALVRLPSALGERRIVDGAR